MRMIVFNKQSWAVGLQWIPPRLNAMSRDKLLATARELRGDALPAYNVVVRRKKQVAFGFCENAADWRNVRSLAALIPDCPSFLGLFHLLDVNGQSFWWLFARNHGTNLGSGDMVYDSFEQAQNEQRLSRELFITTVSKRGFESEVTCDSPVDSEAWLREHCAITLLHKVLGSGLILPLDAPRRRREVIPMAIGLVSLLGLTWAGVTYYDYHTEQTLISQARQLAETKAAQKQRLLDHPENLFAQEWSTAPQVASAGTACVETILSLPTVTSGWLLDGAICSGRTITVSWAHATTSNFLALPQDAKLESPQMASSRKSVSVRLAPRPAQPFTMLYPQEKVRRIFYQLCQSTGTRLQLSFQPAESIKVEKEDVTAPWIKGKWELSSISPADVLDGSVLRVLDAVPGVILTTIRLKNDVWTFQGSLYAVEK